MLADKIQLTAKDILEKNFKTEMRGYKQSEVDYFLDQIMKDYNSFRSIIDELQQENTKLKKKCEELAKRPAQAQASQQTGAVPGTTNFDILKRLSNLEKHVFGSKLYNE